MLDKLCEWCSKWRLTINSEKTKIIHFRPVTLPQCNDNFSCGNTEVEITDKYKYLGFLVSRKPGHEVCHVRTGEVSRSSPVRTICKIQKRRWYGIRCIYTIVSITCRACTFYCAGIWGLTDYTKINTVQN